MIVLDKFEEINLKSETALALGNFDGLHAGHRKIIDELKKSAAELHLKTVICSFSPHPLVFFGKDIKFLSTPEKKAELFAELNIDYFVNLPFEKVANLSPEDFFMQIIVEKLNAKSIIVGIDYKFGKDRKGDIATIKKLSDKLGIKYKFVEKLRDDAGEIISSSRVRSLLSEGSLEKASEFLCRFYSIKGEVVRGDGNGDKMGFPTVNIKSAGDILVPFAAYATKIKIDDKFYNSMSYVGTRPTLNGSEIRIEANIFDFDKSIYGNVAEVFFISKIRDEKKFASLDELKKQLEIDKKEAKAILKDIG